MAGVVRKYLKMGGAGRVPADRQAAYEFLTQKHVPWITRVRCVHWMTLMLCPTINSMKSKHSEQDGDEATIDKLVAVYGDDPKELDWIQISKVRYIDLLSHRREPLDPALYERYPDLQGEIMMH